MAKLIRSLASSAIVSWIVLGAMTIPLRSQSTEGLPYEVLLENLSLPTAIALQPKTGVVHIAESGNRRIIARKDNKTHTVIEEFNSFGNANDPRVQIGPLALAFLDERVLIVSEGGTAEVEDGLSLYQLDTSDTPLLAEARLAKFSLASENSLPAEGNYFSLLFSGTDLYVACHRDDTTGWIGRSEVINNRPQRFERYVPTKEGESPGAPAALAISPEGYLLVGKMGSMDGGPDSRLAFYDQRTQTKLLELESDLHDVVSIAYSPRGFLYALDLSFDKPQRGGLYKIIRDLSNPHVVQAKRLMALDHPSAMVFDSDGSLLITTCGDLQATGRSEGQLIRVSPGL